MIHFQIENTNWNWWIIRISAIFYHHVTGGDSNNSLCITTFSLWYSYWSFVMVRFTIWFHFMRYATLSIGHWCRWCIFNDELLATDLSTVSLNFFFFFSSVNSNSIKLLINWFEETKKLSAISRNRQMHNFFFVGKW